MKLRFTLPALAELDATLSYITARSPRGADKVKARIKTVLELLLRHPRAGRATDEPTIRRINVVPYPYLIFYEIGREEIIVHAVRHGALDPDDMPGGSE